MDLNEFQKQSRDCALYKDKLTTIDGLTYAILALCGESGELANKLKKAHRARIAPDKLVLADELGDCLWYVASVAHELGMNLEEIAQMNISKLNACRSKKEQTE